MIKIFQTSATILTVIAASVCLAGQQPVAYLDKDQVEDVFQGVPLTTNNPDTYFGKAITGDRQRFPVYEIERASNYDTRPHALFFVHGLLGAEETFGHTENLLKRDLAPYKNLRIKNLSYPTVTNSQNPREYQTSKNLHPFHFAKIINAKVISFLIESGLNDLKTCQQQNPEKTELLLDFKKCITRGNTGVMSKERINNCAAYFQDLPQCASNIVNLDTPYSVIVHSQGGLTMASFLNSCYNHKALGRPTEYCSYQSALDIMTHKVSKHLNEEGIFRKEKKSMKYAKKYDAQDMFQNIHLKENAGTPTNFKNMISLGSPFWGAPTANFGQDMALQYDVEPENGLVGALDLVQLGFISLGVAGINVPFPIRQIFRLAIGSAGLSWQRNLLLQRNKMSDALTGKDNLAFEDWSADVRYNSQVPRNLKVYNIAGIISTVDYYADIKERLTKERESILQASKEVRSWNFPQTQRRIDERLKQIENTLKIVELTTTEQTVQGLARPSLYENDVIVGAPEARLDFIYSLENPLPGYPPLEGMTDLTDEYIPLYTGHVDLGPNAIGMAAVTYSNAEDHPSYAVIQSVLKKEFGLSQDKASVKQSVAKHVVSTVHNFTSEIKIAPPIGYHRRFNIAPDNVDIRPERPEVFETTSLPDKFYIQASGYNQADVRISHHYPQTFYHIGRVNRDFAFRPNRQTLKDYKREQGTQLGHKLYYTVDLIGFRKKNFHQFVLPAVNSYKETFLTPYLPFEANLPKLDNGLTLVASIPVTKNETRHLYIKPSGDLVVKNEFAPTELNCHIGLMGQASPPRFRFKSAYRRDYLNHPKHLANFINDDSTTIVNFSGGSVGSENQLDEWYWYAPHKNLPLLHAKKTAAPHFDPQLFEDLKMPTGTALEIVGRYTEGFVDPIHGHGRRCTRHEKNELQLDGCDIASRDLYLVTSPDIRAQDNVSIEALGLNHITKTFSSNGIDYTYSHLAGLRWVPVKDVDVLQKHQNVKLKSNAGDSSTPGNKCLWWDEAAGSYLPAKEYFEQYHYPYNLKAN